MEKSGRGYSLRYAVDVRNRIAQIAVAAACFAGLTVMEVIESSQGNFSIWKFMSLPLAMLIVWILYTVMELLAQLHIVPEGITVTLFGKTLRRFPADQIRFISGVRLCYRAYHKDLIAVCMYLPDELSELWKKRTPKMFQNSRELYPGENAGKYLYRKGYSLSGEMNCQKRILWLDWSPERLEILRQMYPDAQWMDTTQKKIFEQQLK